MFRPRLWIPTLLVLLSPSLFAQDQAKPQADKPKAKAAQPSEPAGNWANWDEVQKLYSTDAIKNITDPEARAQVQTIADESIATRQDALSDFKKGAGLGLSVAMGGRRKEVDDAAIVSNKVVVTSRPKDHPRAALEMHQLFTTNIFTSDGRKAALEQLQACGVQPINCPMVGIGPFAAIQTGDSDSINSIGLGVMVGLRTDPRQTSSFNLGIGVAFDSHVKQLAAGFEEGATVAAGITDVKFTERSGRRLLITLSFAF